VPTSPYNPILVETYENTGDKFSRQPIRVRPIKEQVDLAHMNVSCSRPIRKETPPGSKFILWCRRVRRQRGTEYLYIHPNREWYPVNEAEAERFLRGETVHVAGASINLAAIADPTGTHLSEVR
jgi:hypothetical protein